MATAPIEETDTQTQPIAELKVFGKGKGAMVFEDVALAAAEILGVQPELTRNEDPMLKIDAAQFETVQAGLEERGYQVSFVKEKTANITLHGHSATIYGQAAKDVAQEFNLPLGQTSKQTPKVKLDRDDVDSIAEWLKSQGYKVESQELESNLKPKVVFREAPDGETYHVYDGSAKNLAKALEREPDETPGGRPMLTFDRAEYRQIKQEFGESLDIATKDLKLEATIATYDGNNGKGAVITGAVAQEVAGVLGLETGYTKPSATTGTAMPKLNLTESQIKPAKEALESQGYKVSFKELEASNVANVSLYPDGGAVLFGKPAEIVAEKMGASMEQTTKQTPMLKLSQSNVNDAIAILKSEGYEINTTNRQSASQPADQAESSSRPRRVVKEVTLAPENQTNVGDLMTYFQAAGVDKADDRATGLSLEYAEGKLTAITSEGHTLTVEGDSVRTNFNSADFKELADFSHKTNQALAVESEFDYDFEVDD
ncbi:hypothetical protein JOY44_25620 (plasmid) [Phormidium sp. CLA17]|uniref:hypothetical protein n=1 Tax=Leptolyngbya sp. Cla-17 TaxID=2803751 RepID=UPI001490C1E1|nr:hypothetical protein [Leptolyngbya sp. Cla-17]MBM0744901.1 hypothetical protein [Leptolyngbya sp. Cla-17]